MAEVKIPDYHARSRLFQVHQAPGNDLLLIIPEGDAWVYRLHYDGCYQSPYPQILNTKKPLHHSGLFRDFLKSIRRLEMTYSFIPEGDAWAYSTNCCHVLANNKLYTINCRRKKARYY
ncbi:hypothetical protein HNW13_023350, partial [Shewanella sp. BF02_Schw]|uniref:hypothetical protein n=1 Tax=Shewanella sp. BF02_Schw TaxID=394908 RepID=UPI001AA16597